MNIIKLIIYFVATTVVLARVQPQQPNIQLKLSHILRNRTHITGEYEVNPHDNTTKFPFNLNEKLKIVYHDTTLKEKTLFPCFFLFQSDSRKWLVEGVQVKSQINLIPLGFKTILRIKIAEILSDIFDCWTSMENYEGRIFLYNAFNGNPTVFVKIENRNINMKTVIDAYFMISKNNEWNFDNDENFAEFMEECKAFPLNFLLLLLLFGGATLIFIGFYGHKLIGFIVKKIQEYVNRDRVIDLRTGHYLP
jgi:hypothetical protein